MSGSGAENRKDRTYLCIDLKSFFASAECMMRGRDPMKTNLVVADESRTAKTICLAVSPSLKSLGISGRARLYQVISSVKKINARRLSKAPGHKFTGESDDFDELERNPSLKLSYIVAPPRLSSYIKYSTDILKIYLKYVSPDDLMIYSIDEVFIDITGYLKTTGKTPHEFAMMLIKNVLRETGITATAGIGPNLYLAKIAMDVQAKHIPADENGVRIAELDEMSYRRLMWTHKPITDFWRVGKGTARKLAENGMYTMGDVARCSIGKPGEFYNEELLYKLFGVGAELLIDHAWGWEPCTIEDIKNYRPKSNSINYGQVLQYPYEPDRARLITLEMADHVIMEMTKKDVATDKITLDIIYDIENLTDPNRLKNIKGGIKQDVYGRDMPSPAHGTKNFGRHITSGSEISNAAGELYDSIVNPNLLIRKIYFTAAGLIPASDAKLENSQEQLSFFDDNADDGDDDKMQKTLLSITNKYGKNAVIKGRDLEEDATAIRRNSEIGGHKA